MIVGLDISYLSLIWDQNYGKYQEINIPDTCAHCYKNSRGISQKMILMLLKNNFSYELWFLQMSHQTKAHPMQLGTLYGVDKFFTCNIISSKILFWMMDIDLKMPGITRIKTVDGLNRLSRKRGIKIMQHVEGCS